ncbi:MAG: hypothetical protein AAB733_03715 [Patescibacteria group bacterium]
MVEQRHSKRQWIFIMILIVLIIVTALFFARDSSVTILPEKERELPVSSRLVLKLNDQLFLTRSYLLLRPTLVAPQLETQSALVVDPYQPLPPTDFMVVNPQTGDRVILQWKDANDLGASTVKIYRSQDEGLTFEVLDTVARGEEKVVDSAVVVDRGVVYRLTSVNQEGVESVSTPDVAAVPTDTIAPQAPTDVVVTPTPGKGVVLTWKKPTEDDLAGVRIYRSIEKGVLGTLIADRVTGESALDETAESGVVYHYVLTSVDAHGNESAHRIPPAAGRANPFIPFYAE